MPGQAEANYTITTDPGALSVSYTLGLHEYNSAENVVTCRVALAFLALPSLSLCFCF
jgi:hypothetical protein